MESQTAPRHTSIRSIARELADTTLKALVLYIILTTLLGRFEIQQISMEPNFHEGQRVVVSQWEQLLSPWLTGTAHAEDGQVTTPLTFKRGQVLVFYPPPVREGIPLVKRIIGLPGDTLEIWGGQVWINGVRLEEAYVHGLPTDCRQYCETWVLEPGQYFMMGDNRPSSLDSRDFGPITMRDVVGRVVLRYWPLDMLEVYP